MPPLTERYRPATLSAVRGQPGPVAQLAALAADPYPCALLLCGPTGTGKTAAARALAADMGVDVAQDEFGGLHTIASGEQTAESVRSALAALRTRPFFGSGWKVLIVNECDRMSDAAAFVWLDALEDLPPRAVVVFTTNDAAKLPTRLRDRCERVEFTGDALALRPAAQELLQAVWSAERPGEDAPPLSAFKGVVENGQLSFRRLLQIVAPFLRSGTRPEAPAVPDLAEPQPTKLDRFFAAQAAAAKPTRPVPPTVKAKPVDSPEYLAQLARQREAIIASLQPV